MLELVLQATKQFQILPQKRLVISDHSATQVAISTKNNAKTTLKKRGVSNIE